MVKEDVMRYFTMLAALAVVASASLESQAGWIFKRSTSVAVCTTANCQTVQQAAKPEKQAAAKPVAGDTSSAMGVALLIVNTGRFRHFGGYNGYEGIGMGLTQEAAESNCCYRNRFAPRDRAFARMSNGMWVCVCRY
jgi:hypothetical protein